MTAQISDVVRYRGKSYALAGVNGLGLFDPTAHGLEPVGSCSACWRGFVVAYRVEGQRLWIDALDICLRGPAPAVLGVEPKKEAPSTDPKLRLWDASYEHLHAPSPFTGGMLLADGFMRELYVHMGFHPAWKFREVHELIFEGGELVREIDHSEKVAELRRHLGGRPTRPGPVAGDEDGTGTANIARWVEQCFSREYHW